MCGRYTLTADLKKVADRFGAPTSGGEWATCAPRYNIAPTQSVIVVGDKLRNSLDNLSGSAATASAGLGVPIHAPPAASLE
jgi:putative SOS response-associated peptidase YedK